MCTYPLDFWRVYIYEGKNVYLAFKIKGFIDIILSILYQYVIKANIIPKVEVGI